MENDYKSFIHDTINLEEIRLLLGDALGPVGEESALLSELKQLSSSEPVSGETELEEHQVPAEEISEEEISSEPSDELNAVGEPAEEVPAEELTVEEYSEEEMNFEFDPVLAAETMVLPVAELEMKDDDDSVDVPSFMLEEDKISETDAALPEEPAAEAGIDTADEDVQGDESQKKQKKKLAAAHEFYYLLHDVVYLLAAVTLIFVFLVRLVGVKGDSMMPTLWNQDYLLLESNFLYRGDDIQYGDIVVLNVPYYEEQNEGPIVKRVIATEGQTVQIDFDSGAVYVDGVMLTENYILEPTSFNWEGELGLEYPAVVPENCIFVLGDNRNDSMDSRFASIGMIDERCVLGKVLFIAMPGQVEDEFGNVITPREWGRIGLVS